MQVCPPRVARLESFGGVRQLDGIGDAVFRRNGQRGRVQEDENDSVTFQSWIIVTSLWRFCPRFKARDEAAARDKVDGE